MPIIYFLSYYIITEEYLCYPKAVFNIIQYTYISYSIGVIYMLLFLN